MATKLAEWCPDCRRLIFLRDDGRSFENHRDRGGRRCILSGRIATGWGTSQDTPRWLATLASAHSVGQFPKLWTRRQAAVHLGLGTEQAWRAIKDAGVLPAGSGGQGGAYLYDPLDIEELKLWRAQHVKFGPPRQYATAAERARIGKERRWAARELIDGRLVAVKAREHGSSSTYNNHGCRCLPCTEDHMRKLAVRKERLVAKAK